MTFGPISLLVPRFPALRDSPSVLIYLEGRKSFDPPQAGLRFVTHKDFGIRWEIQFCWKTRPRRACPVEVLTKTESRTKILFFRWILNAAEVGPMLKNDDRIHQLGKAGYLAGSGFFVNHTFFEGFVNKGLGCFQFFEGLFF